MAYFLDCYIQTLQIGKRIRLKPLEGQLVPPDLYVECDRSQRKKYPVGTIFKADLKVIEAPNKKPYLMARHRKIERAIEYFEHNLNLLNE